MSDINIATLKEKKVLDHFECEDCLEDYLFKMKDKHHEFYIGLKTMLGCLGFAEKEGVIPELPKEWWIEVMSRYYDRNF